MLQVPFGPGGVYFWLAGQPRSKNCRCLLIRESCFFVGLLKICSNRSSTWASVGISLWLFFAKIGGAEHGLIAIVVLVDGLHLLDHLVKSVVVVAIDKGSGVELQANVGIPPIYGTGSGGEGLYNFFGRIAGLGVVFEGHRKFIVCQKHL